MGKTARWFRGLLGGKKAGGPAVASDSKPHKEKRRWSFVRSLIEKDRTAPPPPPQAPLREARNGSYREGASGLYADPSVDHNKHAIAVAAATAAVAEAAVAAAQAAAAVVRLTSSSGRCAAASAYVSGRREESAAVKIQSAFRGYLARRALRALKGLVKLQALVRGHIVRKDTAEGLRRMQALVRVQARARAVRSHGSDKQRTPSKGSHLHMGPATPEKHERVRCSSSAKHDRSAILKRNASKKNGTEQVFIDGVNMKWLDRWMDEQSKDQQESPVKGARSNDEKGDKILEVDPGKPHFSSKRRNSSLQSSQSTLNAQSHSHASLPDSPSKDSTTAQLSNPSPSSVEIQSLSPLRLHVEVDDLAFCTADNSPQFFSASSRPGSAKRGPFTPAKSDCSGSLLSRYSDYPNYMANTESFKAKVRSQSAPRQRPDFFEKCSSTKRLSVYGFGDARVSTGNAQLAQRSSIVQARFASKAYPGSGRLDKLGMPIREVTGYSGSNRSRF